MSNRSVFLVNIPWNDFLSVFDAHAHTYTQTKVERGNRCKRLRRRERRRKEERMLIG